MYCYQSLKMLLLFFLTFLLRFTNKKLFESFVWVSLLLLILCLLKKHKPFMTNSTLYHSFYAASLRMRISGCNNYHITCFLRYHVQIKALVTTNKLIHESLYSKTLLTLIQGINNPPANCVDIGEIVWKRHVFGLTVIVFSLNVSSRYKTNRHISIYFIEFVIKSHIFIAAFY